VVEFLVATTYILHPGSVGTDVEIEDTKHPSERCPDFDRVSSSLPTPAAPVLEERHPRSVSVAWYASVINLEEKFDRKSLNSKDDEKVEDEEKESKFQVSNESTWFTLEMSDGFHGFVRAYHGQEQHCTLKGLSSRHSYICRVRSERGDKVSRWSPTTSVTAGDELPFCFDAGSSGPNIRLSQDGLTASFTSNEMWSTVLGTTGFGVGVNRWAVHIEKSVTAYIFIGVASRDVGLCNFLGGDSNGWGYIGDRALYHQRSKVKSYGERFSQGDTIGVTLDMDRGTLSFTHNGASLGVAFEGLSGELFPAVAFYNRGQRLSLVPEAFNCPGAGVIAAGLPSSDLRYGNIASSRECIRRMLRRQPLPIPFLQRCYRSYLLWRVGDTRRGLTRSGAELQFDLSEAKCQSLGYGFLAGDRVATPRGQATVVGVAENKLWFHVDGDSGAWFFSAREMRINKHRFALISRPRKDSCVEEIEVNTKGEGKGSFKRNQSKTTACDQAGDGINRKTDSQSSTSHAAPTFSKFCTLAEHDGWNVRTDEVIISAVNQYCFTNTGNPWNLGEEFVSSLESKMLAASSGKLGVQHIEARLALLKEINEDATHLIPFCDFAVAFDGPNQKYPSAYHSANSGFGLTVSGSDPLHPQSERSIEEKDQIAGLDGVGVDRESLGSLICAARGWLFVHEKQKLMKNVLARTATKAKKAEDDYDYPDDLPQVVLNRPKAAAARERRDPVARLSGSLFGQLFDELHFLEPSTLRIAYSHPMDDGQQRTFKVKFEGEGVDDYGGPYRECFSQLCAELQAIIGEKVKRTSVTTANLNRKDEEHSKSFTDEAGEDDRESKHSRCVLPLLIPSPDSEDGHYIPNPSACRQPAPRSQLYMEMFNFMGQLLGISMRNRIALPIELGSFIWKPLVGQSLNADDLRSIDRSSWTEISKLQTLRKKMEKSKSLRRNESSCDGVEAVAEVLGDMAWTVALSDGTKIELCKDGARRPISPSNLSKYIRAALLARVNESREVTVAMRDGLTSIVPKWILPLFTWKEMRLMVCGQSEVNIDMLQQNTEYDDDVSPTDPHVISFWRVLRSFSVDDKSAFLRFVWARSRLPATTAEFNQKFKLQAPAGTGPKMTPDVYLPKAHTCFFSLNLPRYTSDQVMKTKLLYAVHHCVEMDADFRLADNEMGGWEQVDVEAELKMGEETLFGR
jgi:hypothetical protein